jgi:translation initiation factor 1A
MPKNTKGGKKNKKCRNENENDKRELIYKDVEDQEYAKVTRMLGSCKLMAQCFDGKERMCTIRGAIIKRQWICIGDIILVSLRGFKDDKKADVLLKYSVEEAKALKRDKQIPSEVEIGDADKGDGTGASDLIDIVFDETGTRETDITMYDDDDEDDYDIDAL